MRGGAAIMIVGVATAIVVEILAANRVIVSFTRSVEIRLSAQFVLVGPLEFVIGWRKGHRTGSQGLAAAVSPRPYGLEVIAGR